MHSLLDVVLGNTALALLPAVAAMVAEKCRRPAVAHVLWILVLVKLATPVLWHVPLLPAAEPQRSARTVEGPANSVSLAPRAERPMEGRRDVDDTRSPREASRQAGLPPLTLMSRLPVAPDRLFLGGWLAGSVMLLILGLRRIGRFVQMFDQTAQAPAGVQAQIADLARHLGLSRVPAVRVVAAPISPMVWCCGGRATLLLPERVIQALPVERRVLIIAHELMHLKRCDHWVRLLEAAVTVALWWHPLVWVARRGLRGVEEQACDASVMWRMKAPGRQYAEVLVETMELFAGGTPACASGLGSLRSLKRRLTMVLDAKPGKPPQRGVWMVLLAGVLLLPLGLARGQGTKDAGTASGADLASAPEGQKLVDGIVEDANGKPVEKADIERTFYDQYGRLSVEARSRSGPDGRFALPAARAMPEKSRPRGVFASIPGVGISPPAMLSDEPSSLRLAPALDLRLTLLTPDGKPAQGLSVWPLQIHFQATTGLGAVLRLPEEISRSFSGKTDANGSCIIHGLPRGARVRLDVDDARFAQLSPMKDVLIAGAGPVIAAEPIQLRRAASIAGRLSNPDTHQPVAGMEIGAQAFDDDVEHGYGWGTAVSDAQGQYVIGRMRPGSYVVSMSNRDEERGEWAAAALDVRLAEGEDFRADIVLTRGGFLQGQVRDADTGKPIPGVDVGLYGTGRPDHAAAVYSRITDVQGRYQFRVPPGMQRPYVMAEVDGYTTSHVLGNGGVKEGATAEVNFQLKPDPTPVVEGIVLGPEGKPVAGATVTCEGKGPLSSRSAESDNAGRFKIRASKGSVLKARWKDLATIEPTSVPGGEKERALELHLQAEATFTLIAQLTDEKGAPVTDATASLIVMSGGYGVQAAGPNADAQGEVRFEKLALDTKYSLWAQGADYGVSQAQVTNPSAGAAREVTVSIVLHKLTAKIAGVVVDENGKPLAGVRVGMNGANTGAKDAQSDADGRFSFRVPEGATALVYIRINGLRLLKPINAKAGQTDLKLIYRAADELPHRGEKSE